MSKFVNFPQLLSTSLRASLRPQIFHFSLPSPSGENSCKFVKFVGKKTFAAPAAQHHSAFVTRKFSEFL